MAMKYNRDVAMRIFEVLEKYLPADFGIVFGEGQDDRYIVGVDEIKDKIWEIDHTVKFYSGVSKMAIITESLGDVAIKVPFNGCYKYSDAYRDFLYGNEYDYADDDEEDWDDDEEGWDFKKKYSFKKFSGGEGRYNDDYCAKEYVVYKELKELGYEKFVAETELLGDIGGRYILAQEFVTSMDICCDKITNSQLSIETSKRIRENYLSAWSVKNTWVAACVEHYGEELSDEFFNYTEDDGYFLLADAHYGNYGLRKDNTPCILDFSDFNN